MSGGDGEKREKEEVEQLLEYVGDSPSDCLVNSDDGEV